MIKKYLLIAALGSATLTLISAGLSETTSKIESYMPLPTSSGGAGSNGLGDRTGSPLSAATCAACHNGGAFGASISMQLLDNGVPVTTYTAGNNYTIEYTVSGSSNGFGFQGGALTSANAAGGSFSSPSAGAQTVSISGRPYVEHLGLSTSGTFQATWTAPAANTGSVNFYGIGIAANGNGGTSGDQVTAPQSMTITESVQPSLTYPGNPFCSDEMSQAPQVIGVSNGTFSAGSGLVINAVNGEIDVAASTPGMYTVNYVYASGTLTTGVTINPNYTTTANAIICENETLTFGTQTLDASNAGLNTEIFQSIDGCDSTVNLTLAVETIDNTTSIVGDTLTANQTGATYQWVDCDNGNAAISGATSMTFTPMVSGNFAVEISLNNCVETSNCTFVDLLAIDEFEIESIVVYPNPVNDILEIKNMNQFGEINTITLIDANGKIAKQIAVNSTSVDVEGLESGIYYLRIKGSQGISTIKVVKK
ncbi:choice-of-anchor V domain-containing protein [Brumimicrobium mesophilum]|uniref:choice-of-anchor V domain-containing protein n=1 Tax=Brumimicrobium mesophilum TaxID=392717 RepID=UPI000D13F7A0|nr:choice-of-anchor V domain-containing protein [Brumimicrobium mesophilum]